MQETTETSTVDAPAAVEQSTPIPVSQPQGTQEFFDGSKPLNSKFVPEPAPTPEAPAEEPIVTGQVAEQKTDTPAPEAPPADKGSSVESPAPISEPAPAQDYGKWLQEQTAGAINSPDELKSLLEIKSNPYSLLKPEEQQLLNVFNEGAEKVQEYLRIQTTDFKAMEPMEMLRYDYLAKNPHIASLPKTHQDVAFEDYKDSLYPNLDSLDEENPRALIDKIKLETQTKGIAAEYEKRKEEMRLVKPSEQRNEGPSQKELDKQAKVHLEKVTEQLQNTKMTYEVKSGDKVATVESEVDKAGLETFLNSPDEIILAELSNPDGTFNYAQMKEAYAWGFDKQYRQKALQAAFEQGYSAQESDLLKEINNPAPTQSSAQQSTEPSQDGFIAAFKGAFAPQTNKVDW